MSCGVRGGGTGSGAIATCTSPGMARASRLVTSTRTAGQPARISWARRADASRTCSQLSRTSSACRRLQVGHDPISSGRCRAPSRRAGRRARRRRRGGLRPRRAPPPGARPMRRPGRRPGPRVPRQTPTVVLPDPPGPIRLTSRPSLRSSPDDVQLGLAPDQVLDRSRHRGAGPPERRSVRAATSLPAPPVPHRVRLFRRGAGQFRVVLQDALVQRTQRGGRFQSQLVDEHRAGALIALQRVGLAPAAVQRGHEQPDQLLVRRVFGDERLQVSSNLDVPPESQGELTAFGQRRQPQLNQSSGLHARPRLRREIRERFTAPQVPKPRRSAPVRGPDHPHRPQRGQPARRPRSGARRRCHARRPRDSRRRLGR